MRKVVLGKSGLEVSAVGFGGIPIQRLSENEAVRVIRRAMDVGVTFIDTAAGYTDSQRKIGKAIRGRRDQLVLASKTPARTKERVLEDIGNALRDLGTDHIDLYQFHNNVRTPEDLEALLAPGGALEGMLDAQALGDIGHIGFTSHREEMAVLMAAEPSFETVQFPFNMVTPEPGEKVLAAAREYELGFIAMKPLCGGQFDDAGLAFRYLNAFADVVPIPGIEKAEEIEEIAALVASGALLQGEDAARAAQIVERLGKKFCRRCMYCEPCPHGVPVSIAMIFDGFVKRMPPEAVAAGLAKSMTEKLPLCTECGTCESRCPYELPIIATLKEVLAKAKALRGEQ